MKIWQILAFISGGIITTVMALAAISYMVTLATPEPAFHWLPIPNTFLFAILALAFDLGMIASVFSALHWWPTNRIAAGACVVLFMIASLFSIHAVRGYIALNLTKAAAPSLQSADLYASIKLELHQAQAHLGQLQAAYTTAARRERRLLDKRIDAARASVHASRTRLAQAKVSVHVSPLAGLEWLLAITLWFFNATCWTAWFGYTPARPPREHDTVAGWLAGHGRSEPQHCAAVFAAYTDWCRERGRVPLAQYTFYARLIELGARKFRDGRNGPTMYALPDHAS
ncbi:MAG TPA: hypothetical protein VMX97_02050 [Hyphomicrobiaceae bacterium]|nr:hypothetical protein [Hyphomicrobiaceae bacterium]